MAKATFGRIGRFNFRCSRFRGVKFRGVHQRRLGFASSMRPGLSGWRRSTADAPIA
jgi:hypothetical protein